MDKIISQLRNNNNILVVSHNHPDGDAIGSLIAMGLSLNIWNKKITLLNESPIPAAYRFLPSVDRVVQKINGPSYDVAMILDCGDLERIGKAVSTVRNIPVIINVDHHVTNTRFGNFQLIDTSACATAEIIYRLIKAMAIPIDKEIATSIYTGIMTDTGSFRFCNTNGSAFSICQEMVEMGVNPYNIAQRVYGSYSLDRIKLLNLALNSIEVSDNGKFSIMTLTKHMFDETNTKPEDVNGFINYAKNIADVKVAALVQENYNTTGKSKNSNMFHVSLRSDGTVDVSRIAASFGGGGHSTAAGFNIESTQSDIKSQIFQIAEQT